MIRKPIDWDVYFLAAARLSELRSKDPDTQVGACIVKNKRIIGLGYNSFPSGIGDDKLPWTKQSPHFSQTKYAYSHHAEPNAILNRTQSVAGATLYTSLLSCDRCAPLMIAFQIGKVIYNSDKYEGSETFIRAREWFTHANIPVEKIQHQEPIELVMLFDNEKTQPFDRKKDRAFNEYENPDFIDWDTYFMGLAVLTSLRSKDSQKQHGSCLINQRKRIISCGYNGLPSQWDDAQFEWSLPADDPKRNIVLSSVTNLLANAPSELANTTLYTTHMPDHVDARMLVSAGVKRIVYGHGATTLDEKLIAAEKMFALAGVELIKYKPSRDKIILDLSGKITGSTSGGKAY
ncbi:MAG: deoxycytidylate deaminase [Candidatus Woesearchaeota archaeon]